MEQKRLNEWLTVGLVQMSMVPSPEKNIEKAVLSVRKAAKKGAQIILLPELFRTRYFPQTKNSEHFQLAEPVPGPTTEIFRSLARELSVVIVVPVFERAQDLYHNTAVVIDADGEIVGIYRKMHIPNDPCYYEKYYFTQGNLGFRSFETRYGKIGVLICWDQWFPEAARLAALSGAEILFYPTAIGWLSAEKRAERGKQQAAWEMIQRSHAIANGIYVAALNRVGREENLAFWGRSFIAGPFGELLARASRTCEEILISRCDLSKIERIQRDWPFLRERRIDAYGAITSRSDWKWDPVAS